MQRRALGWGVLTAGSAMVLWSVVGPVPISLAAAPAGSSPEEGEKLFQQMCATCHTIGGGKLVGPDLNGVTARRDRDWLLRFVKAPDKMFAEGDPIATQLLQEFDHIQMPNLGLTDQQVEALIAYLETQAGKAPAPQPAQAALPPGDADIGRALFIGSSRLQNGGPPCMACHSVGGIGALGGGALGPDLTQAFNKYNGETGLAAFLGGVPTPTMNAIWSQRPLTPQERAHLISFLRAASVSQRAPQVLDQLALLAAGGVVVLLALAHLFWRRRLSGGVRKAMLRQTEA